MESAIESVFVDPSFKKLNRIKFPHATSKLLVSYQYTFEVILRSYQYKVIWGQFEVKILLKECETIFVLQ